LSCSKISLDTYIELGGLFFVDVSAHMLCLIKNKERKHSLISGFRIVILF
jgi:hypothetical protein